MNNHTAHPGSQRGVMLLEALIAILIFSMGILAIVGLQVTSIKMASDSKYRSDANLLANRLIGEMWLAHNDPAFLTGFQTGGASHVRWASSVAGALPTTGAALPTVAIVQNTGLASSTVSSTVTIDIFWQVPGEDVHRYNTQTEITH